MPHRPLDTTYRQLEEEVWRGRCFLTHGHLTVSVYGEGAPHGLWHTAQPAGFPGTTDGLLLRGVDCGGCR